MLGGGKVDESEGCKGKVDESEGGEGLVGYFDMAHTDTPSMRSTCGYIFPLCGSPISWVSKV